MSMRRVVVTDNVDGIAAQAVEIILRSGEEAIHKRGTFHFCLSGGNTPLAVYKELAPRYHLVPSHFYWGDERCVPPDHEQSNFRNAWETFLQQINPTFITVHRLRGEIDPAIAAAEYEAILRSNFGRGPHNTSFDLLLLGLGEDAHTASLFPGVGAELAPGRWAIASYIQKLAGWRLTLTPEILNRSRRILFLVSGQNKAAALSQVLQGKQDPNQYPAQWIDPGNDAEVVWLVDRPAATQILPSYGSPDKH